MGIPVMTQQGNKLVFHSEVKPVYLRLYEYTDGHGRTLFKVKGPWGIDGLDRYGEMENQLGGGDFFESYELAIEAAKKYAEKELSQQKKLVKRKKIAITTVGEEKVVWNKVNNDNTEIVKRFIILVLGVAVLLQLGVVIKEWWCP